MNEKELRKIIEEQRIRESEERLALMGLQQQMYSDEQLNYLRDLIEASSLPQYAKMLLPGLFDRNTILGNYNQAEFRIVINQAKAILLDIAMYIPPEKFTENIKRELENFELLHFKMATRGKFGETMKLQRTSIIQSQIHRVGGEKEGNILSKIFGK